MKKIMLLLVMLFSLTISAKETDYIGGYSSNCDEIKYNGQFVRFETKRSNITNKYGKPRKMDIYIDNVDHSIHFAIFDSIKGTYKILASGEEVKELPSSWVYQRSATNRQVIGSTVINSYDVVEIPIILYDRYNKGKRLFEAGSITISIGAPLMFVGGILYGVGLSKMQAGKIQENNTNYKDMSIVGAVFLGVGSTLVGVSVPLMISGAHLKNETNATLNVYQLLQTRP